MARTKRGFLSSSRFIAAAVALGFGAAACSGDGPSGPTTGSLTISVSGLPAGAAGSITLIGAGGFTRTLTGTETIPSLKPGSYTITSAVVLSGGARYAPRAASQTITVAASRTPATTSVDYEIASGVLSVNVSGFPAGSSVSLVVTGPAGYSRTLTGSETLFGVDPGNYTVRASDVSTNGRTWAPNVAAQDVAVVPSLQAVEVVVRYAVSTGGIALTVTGLPSSTSGAITVTGPDGFNKSYGVSADLTNLKPGTYAVTAAPVTSSGNVYSATPPTQSITVAASEASTPVATTYALSTGAIGVSVTGLPPATAPDIQVTGPGGFSRAVTAATTLTGLVPGSYTVTADPVSAGTTTYTPTPTTQTVAVTTSLTAVPVAISYAPGGGTPGGLNLTVDGFYITQAVQTRQGTVPLIIGRDGFLRVFVKATQANTARPAVRVRFYNALTLVNTMSITAPSAAVPTTVDEGALTLSWNVAVPASLITTGMRVLVDVDPTNAVTEANEADNQFPQDGTPDPIDVRTVAPLAIRFVPVTQASNGLTGNVSDVNMDQFLAFARKIYPIAQVNVDVRTTYTTQLPVLDSDDRNGAWISLLQEIDALRIADGSQSYYAGIAKVTYSSGVAGYGYVPGKATIGWDYLPSGSLVTAHELGHNLSRQHAPCGGAADPDPSFPYFNGVIGVYGYDVATGTIKLPNVSDVMGYCGFNWISDHNYVGILNYRDGRPGASIGTAGVRLGLGSSAGGVQPSLLVWGRIVNGKLVLEPSFSLITQPVLPDQPGRYRVEGLDAQARSLFSYSFAGAEPADVKSGDQRHFAFAIPLDATMERTLTTVRLTDGAREVSTTSTLARAGATTPSQQAVSAERRAGRTVRVSWSDTRLRMAMVRDGRTGEVLSFARNGSTDVRSSSGDLEVVLSDGVRSVTRRVRAK